MFMFDKSASNWEPKRPRLVRLAMVFLWLGIISILALVWLAIWLPDTFFVPAVFLVPALSIAVPALFVWIHVKGQLG